MLVWEAGTKWMAQTQEVFLKLFAGKTCSPRAFVCCRASSSAPAFYAAEHRRRKLVTGQPACPETKVFCKVLEHLGVHEHISLVVLLNRGQQARGHLTFGEHSRVVYAEVS